MTKHALIVTYTMPEPAVVGVFFRALRLTEELVARGWRVTVCNFGQLPEDPKVTRAAQKARLLEIGCPTIPTHRFNMPVGPGPEGIARFLRSLEGDVIIFGESPFGNLEQAYAAAASLPLPFVLLEQYYSDLFLKPEQRANRVLLYGLQCLWDSPPRLPPPFKMVPPFVGELAAASKLPVPQAMRSLPWLTVLGFDQRVLQRGLELASRLENPLAVTLTLSHDPEQALSDGRRLGLDERRLIHLPLQEDEVLFALIAHSRCVVLANGFMQLMEALALGCPAIAVDRGLGMADWQLDQCFRRYVSSGDSFEGQLQHVRQWLHASPFSEATRAALARERHGARSCADHVEELVSSPASAGAAVRAP